MPEQVNVRSVEALESFEGALSRAQDEALEFLTTARAQVSTMLDWITEREHQAQRSVSEAEDHLSCAQDNLTQALNEPYDEDEGPPDCSEFEEQVSDAGRELDAAVERREEVQRLAGQVRTAAEDFLHSARQLHGISGERMRMAQLFVRAKARELRSYLAVTQSSPISILPGLSAGPAGSSVQTNGRRGSAGASPPRFAEKGMVSIGVDDIPDEEIGLLTKEDFRKYSYDEMLEGARCFDRDVRPAVETGSGRDYFQAKDRETGSDYEHGLERLYDAYFGSEPIRVTRLSSGRLEVTNGRHRLFVAKQAGVRTVPVSLVEETGGS